MIFAVSGLGLTDAADDCSAPCELIQAKVYEVNGQGYGYKQCEFRGDASRYVSAAVEKQSKTNDFHRFLTRVD